MHEALNGNASDVDLDEAFKICKAKGNSAEKFMTNMINQAGKSERIMCLIEIIMR